MWEQAARAFLPYITYVHRRKRRKRSSRPRRRKRMASRKDQLRGIIMGNRRLHFSGGIDNQGRRKARTSSHTKNHGESGTLTSQDNFWFYSRLYVLRHREMRHSSFFLFTLELREKRNPHAGTQKVVVVRPAGHRQRKTCDDGYFLPVCVFSSFCLLILCHFFRVRASSPHQYVPSFSLSPSLERDRLEEPISSSRP